MIEVTLLGLALGAGEALAIGPLFIAIIHEAAARGFRAGWAVILGATATDAIFLPLLLLGAGILAATPGLLPWLSMVGVAGLLYLGIAAGRDARRLWRGIPHPVTGVARSFRRGILVTLTSPLGWVLWLGADLPALMHSREVGGLGGLALFVVAWFGASVALEAALAFGAARTGRALGGQGRACLSAGSAGIYFVLAATTLATTILARVPGN